MPIRVVLSSVALCGLMVIGLPPAEAASVRPEFEGFTAEYAGTTEPANCISAVVSQGDTLLVAAGGLYTRKPGAALNTKGGGTSVDPWGLAVGRQERLFATQPACDTTVNPTGSNCNLVEFRRDSYAIVKTVPNVCGFAVATHPQNGRLYVASRSGGQISEVDPDSGTVRNTLNLGGGEPASSLSWSSDGQRLWYVRQGGEYGFLPGSGGARKVLGNGAKGVNADTEPVGLAPFALVTIGEQVRLVAPGTERPPKSFLASGSSSFGVVGTGPSRTYLSIGPEVFELQGKVPPPPPPPPPPPTASAPATGAARVPPPAAGTAAPPPAAPPQAPPPPPPPAPPVPPLATATQLVAQPSAAANPALVPADEEREAALRLAATGLPPSVAPLLIWLALAVAACTAGAVVGVAARPQGARAYARRPT
jgi:hypothetical protein